MNLRFKFASLVLIFLLAVIFSVSYTTYIAQKSFLNEHTQIVSISKNYVDLQSDKILKNIIWIAAAGAFLSILGSVFIVRFIIKALLKEIYSFKKEFISNVSHEFKSPLFVIEGYCNLLLEKISKKKCSYEQQLRGLNSIKEAAVRLTGFINNILDLTKIIFQERNIKTLPVRMDEAIRAAIIPFHSIAALQKKTLVCNLQSNLPIVGGETERIKQAIKILLENTFKFTKSGDTITINTGLSPSYGKKYVEIQIAGIRISKEDSKGIFGESYQIRENKYKRSKNANFALSIAYEIIKLHRGKIWTDVEPDKKGIFKFVLPVLKL